MRQQVEAGDEKPVGERVVRALDAVANSSPHAGVTVQIGNYRDDANRGIAAEQQLRRAVKRRCTRLGQPGGRHHARQSITKPSGIEVRIFAGMGRQRSARCSILFTNQVESRTSGVPAPALHEVRRERLLESLHRHRARPLILLVAAAGFGKSTLAATYARDSGGAVAWVTVRPADRDTRRLFERLADALDAGFGEPGSVPELRRGLQDGAEGVGLARLLLDDLAQAPSGFIIVLDDFHLLGESEDVVNSIDALIRELPEAGQIIITARDAPALSMTRLVVDGAVFPLGTEDLRFSPDEARALRKKIRDASTDDSQREVADAQRKVTDSQREVDDSQRKEREAEEDRRDEQAEGWVAGILLGGAPRTLNIGGGSLLGSYVEREVLSRLSPTEQGWLEMLSVLDVITQQAAERLLGVANWPSRLLALTERCPFLVAGQDGSYRLHGLVRETVLNRLRRSPDDRATHAWTVARELAEEAADPVAVVRACQELGQIDGAAQLVLRAASEALQTGRWPAVLVTLELLPEPIRRAHPELSLIEARACLNTGQPARAHEAAEAALQHGGRSGDVVVQVGAIIELAIVSIMSDIQAAEDWLAAADHLLRHTHLPIERHRLLEGRSLGVQGVCAQMRGDNALAREHFENGERLLALLGPSRDLALFQQNFGSFCNRTGDYVRAQAALASAASHWRLVGDRNGLATTQTILGDLHLRLGSLDSAGTALNDALLASRSVGALRMETFATVSLAQWHRANGRLTEAVAAFDEGARLSEQIVERELFAEALIGRAEVALLLNDLPTARDSLARAQAEAQRIGSSSIQAAVDRALGRLHLVDTAFARATSHLEAARDRGFEGWGADQRAETLYWLGTSYLVLGRAQQAVLCLEQAIATAQEISCPALLAGSAAEDPRLLQHGRQMGVSSAFLGEVERQSATRIPWTGVSAPPVSILVHNDLPRLEVQLFGSFALHRNGQLIANASRKVDRIGELAAVLILNPKGMHDEAIAELMFPEMKPERGLHNLQMAASSLRKLLGSKAAVRYGAGTYQLSPQLEIVADVRDFDSALARARGTTGESLVQFLSKVLELYRGPLLPDAAWEWLEPVRLDYRARFVSAAVQLADVVAPIDSARSDALAERVLGEAPETDVAYERLIQNARQRRDRDAVRRLIKRYVKASVQHGFALSPYFTDEGGGPTRAAH